MIQKKILEEYTYEQLAHALYLKGEKDGFAKITDKTKWREPVMANKLNHKAHSKISAGAGKDEYGSDAIDITTGRYAEYKSQAINDKELRNLHKVAKGNNGKTFAALTVTGVYNGAYKQSALDAYAKVDHFFGIFHKEKVLLIIKVNTEEVIRQLTENNVNRKKGATTNLNSVRINLDDTHLYEKAYKA
tara:strand:- start:107 stop:673 length:567 start_codon:yes stop_codon:yes gene_type:complete